MAQGLPAYYFRVRENGAAVFRVDPDTRDRRLALDQIAVLNIKNGEVKPQGGGALSDADSAAIERWMAERRGTLAARETDDVQRLIDRINLTTHWAQTRASADALEDVTDPLLLAMHDLREVLVRKKSERLGRSG
ncbi:MAG: hypothetical protein AAF943_04010 [Pseudomonadota bacterium]